MALHWSNLYYITLCIVPCYSIRINIIIITLSAKISYNCLWTSVYLHIWDVINVTFTVNIISHPVKCLLNMHLHTLSLTHIVQYTRYWDNYLFGTFMIYKKGKGSRYVYSGWVYRTFSHKKYYLLYSFMLHQWINLVG